MDSRIVRWGSASKHALEGLPEERKALAVRYTIDSAEAARREELAAEPATRRVKSARRAGGASAGWVYRSLPARTSASERPASTATRPLPGQLPRLKARLGHLLNRDELPLNDVYVRARATPEDGPVRCARCGNECSRGAGGWTLRLCADDQLHAVCRDCDDRDFSNAGRVAGALTLRPLAD
jgi:hypothetical protein